MLYTLYFSVEKDRKFKFSLPWFWMCIIGTFTFDTRTIFFKLISN